MCKGCICVQPFIILEGVLNCEIKTSLTVGNINKKLWAFAIPLMLGNVMQQFYNLVDTSGSRKLHRRQCFGGGRFVIFTDDIFNIGDFGIVSW